ncbi:TetR family transcriptional regulator [Saccharothrix variisporea]|uniref:TetR family transcriptional regulator n=2 Tax=Saccharothrix variisporea TaxID=543527 RepID=A0A495X8M4_9PSEU|nr:TetR family transcriptional regulator [Saccharothrix variisporea]
MWYMTEQEAKSKLLARVVDHLAHHGLGDLSLRQIAAAVNTSHRMLIYHFGSKEGLLVEIVRAVEANQRALLSTLQASDQAELARRFWRALTDPALRAHERLFFELYGQAVQGRRGTTALLEGIVESWLEPITEMEIQRGHAPEQARIRARLGLAVARGLLLDLVATDDVDGVTAAMDLFIDFMAS